MRSLRSTAGVQPRLTMSGFIADGIGAHQARYQFTMSATVVAILSLGIAMASVTLQSHAKPSAIAIQVVEPFHAVAQARMPARPDLGG